MKKVAYDEACNLVNEVRRGGKENILCIVVADNNCPFCFQLTNTIYPEVKNKFGDEIEFVEFIQTKDVILEHDNFIFPVERSPVSYFYVKNHVSFPILKFGVAPIEAVMLDIEQMVKENRKNNVKDN
jgi:hypothetical protein